jgi:hypothetical protein
LELNFLYFSPKTSFGVNIRGLLELLLDPPIKILLKFEVFSSKLKLTLLNFKYNCLDLFPKPF